MKQDLAPRSHNLLPDLGRELNKDVLQHILPQPMSIAVLLYTLD